MLYSDFKRNIDDIFEMHTFKGTKIKDVKTDDNNMVIIFRNKGNPTRPDMIMIVELDGDNIKTIDATVFRSCKYFKEFKNSLTMMSTGTLDFEFNIIKE